MIVLSKERLTLYGESFCMMTSLQTVMRLTNPNCFCFRLAYDMADNEPKHGLMMRGQEGSACCDGGVFSKIMLSLHRENLCSLSSPMIKNAYLTHNFSIIIFNENMFNQDPKI